MNNKFIKHTQGDVVFLPLNTLMPFPLWIIVLHLN